MRVYDIGYLLGMTKAAARRCPPGYYWDGEECRSTARKPRFEAIHKEEMEGGETPTGPQSNGVIKDAKYDGRRGPSCKALKKGRKPLSKEERTEVMRRKATWCHGPRGEKTPAVWKSVVNGKTWYATNTHRAMNVMPTLKGAINCYHKFIKSTS